MNQNSKFSYTSQSRRKRQHRMSSEDPIGIRVDGATPKWKIPDDIVDEMLAELREEENAAHE